MFITITLQLGENCFDVQVDRRQTIAGCVDILRDTGKYGGEGGDFYRASSACAVVGAYRSFEEAGIHTGEKLTLLENK